MEYTIYNISKSNNNISKIKLNFSFNELIGNYQPITFITNTNDKNSHCQISTLTFYDDNAIWKYQLNNTGILTFNDSLNEITISGFSGTPRMMMGTFASNLNSYYVVKYNLNGQIVYNKNHILEDQGISIFAPVKPEFTCYQTRESLIFKHYGSVMPGASNYIVTDKNSNTPKVFAYKKKQSLLDIFRLTQPEYNSLNSIDNFKKLDIIISLKESDHFLLIDGKKTFLYKL